MNISTLILLTIMALCWSVGNIIVKKSFQKLTPWQIYAFDAVIIALPLWLIYGYWQNGSILNITPLAFASAFLITVVYGIYYYTIYIGPMGLTTPIIASYPIFTVILALILLKEKLSIITAIGVILTISGAILISVPEKLKFKLQKWVILALIVSFGYGVTGYTGKLAVDEVGNASYLIALALTQVLVVILWKFFISDPIPKISVKNLKLPFIGIFLLNIGNIVYYIALENGYASIVVPLSNAYIVLLVILSIFILKEKILLHQIIGIIIVITGVIFVNLPVNKLALHLEGVTTKGVATNSTPTPTIIRQKAYVNYVFDGDTIELSDKRRVRYIGINSPELNVNEKKSQCFAADSAKINREFVLGQEIEMEKDVSETDKYGRLLRYVYLDGIFLNEFLIRQGYTKLETVPPDTRHAQEFIKAEKEAKKEKRGLWGKCPL